MRIDELDGTIIFPNGLSISPSITQQEFIETPGFASAESKEYGTLPYIHYRFSGGCHDGKELSASVCFYDQMFLSINISANLYPPGDWDWSNYSLEVESKAKHFHDQLLEQILGKPTKGGSFLFHQIPEIDETLKKPLEWRFPWGNVYSGHDWRGGGTSFGLNFGTRHEKAHWAYKRMKGELE
ncbi:hypothetical protein [Bythopirellula polymerisocia]|uniref:Uncharacterized protein n=1 Tax=Bythopirellula polymerisocia TaxID=2528003 RepID=A0A5C6CN50_9BACT|nr:hypothetical protein [Bythopirellula polymerisocia]TWU25505.1 hypothetical protein Pla144_27100 [Bythopirellula polymerisocia]